MPAILKFKIPNFTYQDVLHEIRQNRHSAYRGKLLSHIKSELGTVREARLYLIHLQNEAQKLWDMQYAFARIQRSHTLEPEIRHDDIQPPIEEQKVRYVKEPEMSVHSLRSESDPVEKRSAEISQAIEYLQKHGIRLNQESSVLGSSRQQQQSKRPNIERIDLNQFSEKSFKCEQCRDRDARKMQRNPRETSNHGGK